MIYGVSVDATLFDWLEVVHELFEFIRSSRKWDDDVNQDVGRVHPLAFHLHQGSKGPEENQAPELMSGLPSEGQLVQRSFVLLCTSDTWGLKQKPEVRTKHTYCMYEGTMQSDLMDYGVWVLF